MRGEIHGHVHNKKDEKVKTAAVMRHKVKLLLFRCPVDGKSNASDANSFAIPSPFRSSEDADNPVLLCFRTSYCEVVPSIYSPKGGL
jgi:hypothetical protein